MPGEKKAASGFPFDLSREGSLKGRSAIRRVLRTGRRCSANGLEFVLAPATDGKSLLAVSAGRKTGKAHDRNLIKRRIRHAFAAAPSPEQPLHVLVIARQRLKDGSYLTLQALVNKALLS